MTRVGVLALQGGFAAHATALREAGAEPVEVRRTAQLAGLDRLVLPGGESTTLLHLMREEPWFDELRAFHARGGAMLATCAGAILLARRVRDPEQPSVGLLDVEVRRNAYGRQVDSFETDLDVRGFDAPLHAVFIRAPRFSAVGPDVEVLASLEGEPVLVRQPGILAATFHPELTGDRRLHREFLAADRTALIHSGGGHAGLSER
ncbi:MAG TPA: pyridoxal 5'-phosphate synthase glutaminase subunit PdxT [Candidatus Polarisedimenticolaceae bacterium]|nr:pyridoxal 5'-phosphate synthase glutaminase subunit PdxT [Candidatus Polarisedimenticolaceae bacterium]